jgi:hypothetical protein
MTTLVAGFSDVGKLSACRVQFLMIVPGVEVDPFAIQQLNVI